MTIRCAWCSRALAVTLSDDQSFADYAASLAQVPGLMELAAERDRRGPEEQALAAELIL